MTSITRDTGLGVPLDLHGQMLVVDEKGGHWVKFVARRVPVKVERPHGLYYSLTLYESDGEPQITQTLPTAPTPTLSPIDRPMPVCKCRCRDAVEERQ